MTKRLMSWAENTDKQAVCQAHRLPKRVGAIFLDIVWHNGLRTELLYMNTHALLLKEISSFLRDTTVKVRILGHASRDIEINYVVPQPSSLPSLHISTS